MPKKFDSTGCFPGQSAISSVSKEDLIKLTYGTSYKNGVTGKTQSETDKWENFIDVHGIGRRDSKYMWYQKQTAPLLDRSACTSRRDFTQHPLGANVVNRLLAKEFAAGQSGGPGLCPLAAKLSSHYQEKFGGFEPERAKAAIQESCRPSPDMTTTVTAMKDLFETRALSHVSYSLPDGSCSKPSEILLPPPNLGFVGTSQGPSAKSSYSRQFRGFRHATSTPQIGKLGGPADVRPSVLLPDGHPSLSMRRLPHMSPGQ